tara:strand:+ start:182166 stop:182729 length:564 start_codon:yes stop_codon:yes gene_type:complete
MKLTNIFKNLITEANNSHSYGCVMHYFDAKESTFKKAQKIIDEKDLYLGTDDDPGYGLETEPHVTVLYGIHADVPDEDVEEKINDFTQPEVMLKDISIFDNADKGFDVVKFDITNKDLNQMNKDVAKLPHTTDYPDYHPHITIAYVKAGEGQKYVQTLSDSEQVSIKPNKIVYSKPDGSKKTYKFNG